VFNANIKQYLVSERIFVRVITAIVVFFTFFYALTILSYYLLPTGFLLGKNSVIDWETSKNLFTSTLQILSYNLVSVSIIVLGNLVAFSNRNNGFIPCGYLGLGAQFAVNAMTLGTWSFTEVSIVAPDLLDRLLRTVDVFHHAALWEMLGQLSIMCATARIAILKTNGKEEISRSIKEIRLRKPEIVLAAFGLCLMAVGAYIESYSIIFS
jgi:magnesium-transporting ATPase (P-type)